MNKLLSAITFLLLTNLVFAQYDTTIISEKHNKRIVKVSYSKSDSSYFTMRLNREGKYVIDGKRTDYSYFSGELYWSISHYKNEKRNGTKTFHDLLNGRLHGKYHFKNDLLNGKAMSCHFDEKGKKYLNYKGRYCSGQKCGQWKQYNYYDTTFNYTVKGKFARKTIYTSYVNETVQSTNSYSSDTLNIKMPSKEFEEYYRQFGYFTSSIRMYLRKGKWVFYRDRKKVAIQYYNKDGILLSEEFFEGYDDIKFMDDFWFLMNMN